MLLITTNLTWAAESECAAESDCAPIFRSIFDPTCIFSLLYTVPKISSISYPYQCLFAPSAQKGMGREKNTIIEVSFIERVN